MAVSLEREFKLRVIGQVPNLLQLKALAGLSLQYLGTKKQRNTYFDSQSQALSRAGYGFRIREVNSECVATLKGPATVNEFGLHGREEQEADLPHAIKTTDDVFLMPEIIKQLPQNILDSIEKIVAVELLQKTVEIFTERQEFALANLGELVLDHVQVPNEKSEIVLDYWEIELELQTTELATQLQPASSQLKKVLTALHALTELQASNTTKLGNALNALGLSSKNF